jgi:hypothetical protein
MKACEIKVPRTQTEVCKNKMLKTKNEGRREQGAENTG